MTYRHLAAAAITLGCTLSLTSCFKDEPLNAECDIEQAYISAGENLDAWFLQATDTLQTVGSMESQITFTVKNHTPLNQMAPHFLLTPGATITPANGSVQDFSNGEDPTQPSDKGVTYTVTSEDGSWHRTYQVKFANPPKTYKLLTYDFENYFLNENKPVGKYYVWSDLHEDGTRKNNWATGNPGYNLSKGSAKPEEYPTVPIPEGDADALKGEGACVKLTTLDTGEFGLMANMPIAAGNLFIGKFDAGQALMDAMKGTQFGLPTNVKPVQFRGWYKYKRGEKYTDNNLQEVAGKKDYGTIYAVLYDNHDAKGRSIVLYGDNVQTSEQVVAIAKLPDIDDTPEWTQFDIPFEYKKEIDLEKLEAMGYSLAIVCSSSVEGASFMGAIGSTLWVDAFSILTETEEDE